MQAELDLPATDDHGCAAKRYGEFVWFIPWGTGEAWLTCALPAACGLPARGIHNQTYLTGHGLISTQPATSASGSRPLPCLAMQAALTLMLQGRSAFLLSMQGAASSLAEPDTPGNGTLCHCDAPMVVFCLRYGPELALLL